MRAAPADKGMEGRMIESPIILMLEYDLHIIENKTPHRWALIVRYIKSLAAIRQIVKGLKNGRD